MHRFGQAWCSAAPLCLLLYRCDWRQCVLAEISWWCQQLRCGFYNGTCCHHANWWEALEVHGSRAVRWLLLRQWQLCISLDNVCQGNQVRPRILLAGDCRSWHGCYAILTVPGQRNTLYPAVLVEDQLAMFCHFHVWYPILMPRPGPFQRPLNYRNFEPLVSSFACLESNRARIITSPNSI